MPARLSGFLDWSGGFLHDRESEDEWERGYPVTGPWKRVVRHGDGLKVVIDTCGDSSLSRCLAVVEEARLGVAGTIRLDRSDDLRRELGAGAHVGDAGLIVAAYLKWGASSFSRFSGEFSFVLWDDTARVRYLVRDPFGLRRLHYTACGDTVVFSTDVEGVLAWRAVDRATDPVTILDFLLARYQTREETFFRSIRRVPPGHHLVIRPGQTILVRHLEIPRYPVTLRSLPEYAEALRYELARAVSERLPETGPVGCHVSGGLDSTSVACLAAADLARRERSHDLVLMNASFRGLSGDEGHIAHELSRHLGVPLQEWDGRVPETSDLHCSRMGWPFGRSSMAGSWQGDLELAARAGATVILGGFGGNQIATEDGFFRDTWSHGHWPAYALAVAGLLGARPWRWQRRHLRRTLVEVRRVIREAWARGDSPPTGKGLEGGPDLSGGPSWLGSRLRDAWPLLPAISGQPAPAIMGSWMADTIWQYTVEDAPQVWTLEHEDARATERGLEFRFPYLSWSLLGLVLSIPVSMRPPTAADRNLQRLALRGVLPERIRTRDTFVRFNSIITLNTQAAAQSIEQLLVSGPWRSEGLVDRPKAQEEFFELARSVGAPLSEERNQGWRRIRDVAALEAWLRRL